MLVSYVPGMRELIDGLVQSAQNNGMELYGVHVYRRGEEPVERRLRSDDRENLWSVSKTFVSVALGIAEAEGRLALDDPALNYYPELKGTAARAWSRSRSAICDDIGARIPGSPTKPVEVPDLAADFFATPLAHEPGSYFSYTGIGPYVAARALRAATGASVRDYLMPRVFGPLAIHNPQWHTCPLGHPVAESDLFLRTSDWPASAGCCWTMAATRAASWSPPGTARGSPPKASPRSTTPRTRSSA